MSYKNKEDLMVNNPLDFVDYNEKWGWKYSEEEERIFEYIEENGLEGFIRIAHIGSTAVIDMKSKPVIDILLEVKKGTDIDRLKSDLESLGYNMLDNPEGEEPNIMAYRGYGEDYIYHIDIRYLKKWDELYLRDHLSRNSDSRREYEVLKLELAEKYKDDRQMYLEEKKKIIKKYVDLEKEEYEKYLKQLNAGFEI